MLIGERLGLAHLAYGRALAAARRGATPASWRRLVTAGENLRSARRDAQRAAAPARCGSAVAAAGVEGVLLTLPPPAPSGVRPPALAREVERARALVARSRQLVQESRRLAAGIAEQVALFARLRAGWLRPAPPDPPSPATAQGP